MFEERYAKMNEGIRPGDEAVRRALAAAKRSRQVHLPRRWMLAAICLVLALLTGTAAATDFDFTALLERWFPETAQDFTRVNLSDSEQGITMTVLQANLTEAGGVELLIEFSGERIDNGSRPYFFGSPETHLQGVSGEYHARSLQGMIPEYAKSNAILWREAWETLEVNQGWYAESGLYTITMNEIGLGTQFYSTIHDDLDLTSLSVVGSLENPHPIIEFEQGMAITGFGFTPDGQFVIQRRTPIDLLRGTSCGACLLPLDGTEDAWQDWVLWTDLRTWEDETDTYRYTEEVYDLSAAELSNYKLRTHYYTVDEVLKGDWSVTIDVNSLTTKAE